MNCAYEKYLYIYNMKLMKKKYFINLKNKFQICFLFYLF